MALRHMIQTWTSSFLQTRREFFRVRRLGKVLDLVTRVELQRKRFTVTNREIYQVSLSALILLPDGVSSCSWDRGGWRGEAAVPMEILYGTTPGRVNGWDLTSRLWLLTIKPELRSHDCYHFESFRSMFSCIHENICQQMKHQLLHLNPNPNSSTCMLIEHVVLRINVLIVFMIFMINFGMISLSNLRYSILCERQILNQNVKTSILLIQKLSDPPTARPKKNPTLIRTTTTTATTATTLINMEYPMWLVRREISSSRSVWVDSWTLLLNFYKQINRETEFMFVTSLWLVGSVIVELLRRHLLVNISAKNIEL